MDVFDCIVIGGVPSGLSASFTLDRVWLWVEESGEINRRCWKNYGKNLYCRGNRKIEAVFFNHIEGKYSGGFSEYRSYDGTLLSTLEICPLDCG